MKIISGFSHRHHFGHLQVGHCYDMCLQHLKRHTRIYMPMIKRKMPPNTKRKPKWIEFSVIQSITFSSHECFTTHLFDGLLSPDMHHAQS